MAHVYSNQHHGFMKPTLYSFIMSILIDTWMDKQSTCARTSNPMSQPIHSFENLARDSGNMAKQNKLALSSIQFVGYWSWPNIIRRIRMIANNPEGEHSHISTSSISGFCNMQTWSSYKYYIIFKADDTDLYVWRASRWSKRICIYIEAKLVIFYLFSYLKYQKNKK